MYIFNKGDKFGLLTVVRETERHTDVRRRRKILCVCECGGEKIIFASNLKSGHTKSCGCKRGRPRRMVNGKMLPRKLKREYSIRKGLKNRCNNKGATGYKYYGGRGITYNSKRETFEGFREDMKEGYSDYLTIDRIDGHGNYCKENCR